MGKANMIGRILRVLMLMAVAALIINRLFSRQHKRSIHYWVRLIAYSFLTVSVLLLLWQWWRP